MKYYVISSLLLAGAVACLTSCGGKVEKKEIEERKHTVVTTPSGLKYEILTPGNGDAVVKGKTAEVHYTGWLNKDGKPDSKAFDSSHNRNQTFKFIVGGGMVIKGWDEGVAGMKIGEKRRLYIPSALGYGARGAGAVIPPHADLIFDVELISFK